jgi:hypothetical protein
MNKEFIELLHIRIAKTSVGASTARRMGPKGTVVAARNYLGNLELSRFSVSTEKQFKSVMNRTTSAYVKKLPEGAQHWGAARKFLNIFLRDIVYNKYLCKKYRLSQIEPWLEVPLDSTVGKGLRCELGGQVLPKWRTVIGMDFSTNKRVLRIHLDLRYWRRST